MTAGVGGVSIKDAVLNLQSCSQVILQCSARICLSLISSEKSIQSATYKPLIHPPLCRPSYISGTNNKDLGKRSHLFTLDTRFTCSAYYTIHSYTPCYSSSSSPHTQDGHRYREIRTRLSNHRFEPVPKFSSTSNNTSLSSVDHIHVVLVHPPIRRSYIPRLAISCDCLICQLLAIWRIGIFALSTTPRSRERIYTLDFGLGEDEWAQCTIRLRE